MTSIASSAAAAPSASSTAAALAVTTVPDTHLQSVLIAFGINSAIAVGLIIAFSLLRPANKVVYQPRLKFAPERKRPKPLGPAPTAWLPPIIGTNENQSVSQLGLDAVMFLRFLKFAVQFFFILTLFGIPAFSINYYFPRITGLAPNNGVVPVTDNGTIADPANLPPALQNQINNPPSMTSSKLSQSVSSAFQSLATSDASLVLTGSSISATSTVQSSIPALSPTATGPTSVPDTPISSPVPSVTSSAAATDSTATAALKKATFFRRQQKTGAGNTGDAASNSTQTGSSPSNSTQTGFQFPNPSLTLFTIYNIDPSSNWFWLPVGLTWLYSLIAYFMVWRLWENYVAFRKEWFNSEEFQHAFYNRTVLLTNVPDSLQSNDSLLRFITNFGLKYPPKQAVINRNLGQLPKLVAKHTSVTKKLESVLAVYLKDPTNIPAQRPTMRGKDGGSRVDAISFLSNEINELEEKIYELRARPDRDLKTTSSAFVSFETIKGAHSAARKLRGNPSAMIQGGVLTPPTVKASPPLDDIIWDNIGISLAERLPRRLVALGATVGLTFGWTIFVAAVGTLNDLQTVFKGNDAATQWLAQHMSLTVLIQAFLAPIILAIANVLLPFALRIISRIQGVVSYQGIEKSVLYKYFAFQVYQVFVFAIYSAVIKASKTSANVQVSVFDSYRFMISEAIAGIASTNSTFYISLLSTYFAGYGFEIIQAFPLFINFFKRRFMRLTPRQEFELNQPPEFNFTLIYGSLCIVFVIAMTFSTIAPVILPFSLIFYCIAYIVMKYQFMYVYEVRKETGGTWWPKVFNLVSIGIGFFQFMTFVVFFVKLSTDKLTRDKSYVVLPLPFITAVLWFYAVRVIAPRAQYVSKREGHATAAIEFGRAGDGGGKDGAALEDQAFNPALVKPLLKVWVPKKSQHLLPSLHTPRYVSYNDYLAEHPQAMASLPRAQKRNYRRFLETALHSRDRKAIRERGAALAAVTTGVHSEELEADHLDIDRAGVSRVQLVQDGEDDVPPEEAAAEAEAGNSVGDSSVTEVQDGYIVGNVLQQDSQQPLFIIADH